MSCVCVSDVTCPDRTFFVCLFVDVYDMQIYAPATCSSGAAAARARQQRREEQEAAVATPAAAASRFFLTHRSSSSSVLLALPQEVFIVQIAPCLGPAGLTRLHMACKVKKGGGGNKDREAGQSIHP